MNTEAMEALERTTMDYMRGRGIMNQDDRNKAQTVITQAAAHLVVAELESAKRISDHDNMCPDGSGIGEWLSSRLAIYQAIANGETKS